MKKITPIILFLIASWYTQGQSFQSFIDHLNALPVYERQAVADSFLHAGHSFPYKENDTLVHFIYTADVTSVAVAGDATGWNPSLSLSRISGTTFWYLSRYYEADARLDYKFVINGSNWILDPRNPKTCTGGYGPNSELSMPAYVVPPEIAYYGNIAHGTIKDTAIYSSLLGNTRAIKVYLPPNYATSQVEYPAILFHDGLEYVTLGSTVNILDYLIAHQLITPVIAVFVPPVDRTAEYAGNKIDLFTGFIITELMPVIDSKYRTSHDPSRRATLGASNGGNIALYLSMKHPESFGKVAAQSSNVESVISNTFQNGPKLNLELYLDIGKYDIPVLIPLVNNFVQILTATNYTFSHFHWNEGHSWGNWKGHLSLPLKQFFPLSLGLGEKKRSSGVYIESVYPNPFRDSTLIKFTVPPEASVKFVLYDSQGRPLETIYSGIIESSIESVTFTNHGYPAGVYFISLESGANKSTKQINIIR